MHRVYQVTVPSEIAKMHRSQSIGEQPHSDRHTPFVVLALDTTYWAHLGGGGLQNAAQVSSPLPFTSNRELSIQPRAKGARPL